MDVSQTNVDFVNQLEPTEDFNMYIFRNFYNGGGVAIGDVSGDGLPDIFLTGNMTSNRLYINQGNFKFKDVTNSAGLNSEGYWSTGASMADVNGDGNLDIYVTLSGPPGGSERHNRLYINNGDRSKKQDGSELTFSESAEEYGLIDDGLSTHGVFFDYNGDDLLDLYLLSNSFHKVQGFEDAIGKDREIPDPNGASKLYRNDGGSFTDVTEEAGIYSSIIGFGLSATVSDLNRDGFPDLYVANDFFERDYLYINNGDGTFSESLEGRMRSISSSSMGSDIADINNDGWPDIYVSDMLPASEDRLKSKMSIESWEEYRENVSKGFHHKFTRNTLQLNRGDGYFSEIGRYANVYATDWSWASLIADFDNSGYSDIFVTNGIYKDLLDQDYIEKVSNPRLMRQMIESGEENVILNLMEQMSSTPLRNFAFRNEGNLKFTDQTKTWGLDQPGFSSGAAWGDLDNDGDLDLVINEVNGRARIYRNQADSTHQNKNWLKVNLHGNNTNTDGIGAELHVWADGEYWFREHYLQRGFQSSVQPGFFVGLGQVSNIDSLVVRWPNGQFSKRKEVEASVAITLQQSEAYNGKAPDPQMATMPGDIQLNKRSSVVSESLLKQIPDDSILNWKHQEFNYNEFNRERLLMHMHSSGGPALCSGDINNDNRTDVYTGGSREQSGVLWLQTSTGSFERHQSELFERDAISEDIDCSMFDATGNGFDDLYVVSGGNSFSSASSALIDRFYLNDGAGNLSKSSQILPTARGFASGSVVVPHDFNSDGKADLFVGSRLRPFAVGMPVSGYLLAGDGNGHFEDVTMEWAPDLREIGMITDAMWVDVAGDQQQELVIAGEWMPIRVFSKQGKTFVEITKKLGLSEITGWWNTLAVGDIDGDNRKDIIAANHGLNSMFHASPEYPVKMWVGDISGNGMIEQIIATSKNGSYYPLALRHDLVEVIPSLSEKYPDYASYAGQRIDQVFSHEQLDQVKELSASHLGTGIFWNRPDGMVFEELPSRAQMAPMFAIELQDLYDDDRPEIILGGNLYNVKPQVGPYDASRGVVITYKNGKLQSLTPDQSGFEIRGENRAIQEMQIGDQSFIIVARNGDTPVLLRSN